MINVVDRRQKSIELIRNENIKKYLKKELVDDNNMMNLGLNMYIEENTLIKNDLYSIFHMSKFDPKVVLHPQQVECLNLLHKNNNMLLSAPTSFGKTFVALEYISRNNFNNIAFIVPTLALMNEIIKKIKDRFTEKYNIITNSFEVILEKNIFVLVPERVDIELISKIPQLDFLIFDEIYKLKRKEDSKDNKRIIALNRGYFDLVEKSNQILLLGPFIKDIEFGRTKLNQDILKYFTDYAPVYNEISFKENRNEFSISEIKKGNSKLLYFKSPGSIYKFCKNNMENLKSEVIEINNLTNWCDEYISEKWLPSIMLKNGIGIHHGELPTFIRKYIENLYNEKKLKNILCTSTLLEGINTPTNELIVYDSELSAFEINNLIGRVGRLGTSQIGRIFLFDKKMEKYILGDEKYEEIKIVAEDEEILDVEEILYLAKNKENLSEDQRKIYEKLESKLIKYNKNIEQLKDTDGFIIKEFITFLENLPDILLKVENLYNLKNGKIIDKTSNESIYRGKIIEEFMKIIKNSNYLINEINKNSKTKIKSSVCVNQLLNKVPNNIYKKIKNQIIKQQNNMDDEVLNIFIDYLFDLAFKYIKYDLNRIVKYSKFILDEDFVNSNIDKKDIIDFYYTEILSRIEIFNSDKNKIAKILIDLSIPYSDTKELIKIINIDEDEGISTGKVIKKLEENIIKINDSSKIEKVTKEIINILVESKV